MNEPCGNIGCNHNTDGRCMTVACGGREMTLYEEAMEKGLVIGTHESDLYLDNTEEARDMCKRRGLQFTTFRRNDEPTKTALDIPFAFDVFWLRRGGTIKGVRVSI